MVAQLVLMGPSSAPPCAYLHTYRYLESAAAFNAADSYDLIKGIGFCNMRITKLR